MKKATVRQICVTALFAAMIFVVTAYFPRVPTAKGYVHLGDTFVYLAGSLLPLPLAGVAGAIGGSLADALSGYPVWVPATLLIKAATAICFSSRSKKIVCARNFAALAGALLICVGGYYVFESVFIAGNFAAPLVSIIPNILQVAVSAAVYIVIGFIIDRTPALRRIITGE